MTELLNTLQPKNKLEQENNFNFVRKGAVRCNHNCIINNSSMLCDMEL